MTDENQVNESPVDVLSLLEVPEVVAPVTSNAKVRTSLTLAPDLFDWVRAHAHATKKSVSAVIGDALAAYRAHCEKSDV